MELRVLNYFVTVVKKGNILKASEALYITQPTLSRQLMDLEREIGKKLFHRGTKGITLTDEGMLLYKRAEEILGLVEKTKEEIINTDQMLKGDIYIGSAESEAIRFLAVVAKELRNEYPNIRYHIFSGNAEDVKEKIDKGLIDFGVLIEPADISKYEHIKLPTMDTWGILMRKDSPLAKLDKVTIKDLSNLPLICSRQLKVEGGISSWLGINVKLNIVATYNLLFNASIMVEEGLGYALCLDKIISENKNLCFRPLDPELKVGINLVWNKSHFFSKASIKFLDKIKEKLKTV